MDLIAFRSSTESCKMTISSNGLVDVPPVSVYVVVGADGSFWKVSCSGSNVESLTDSEKVKTIIPVLINTL